MGKITPFLWFDNQAEEAANFYVSIFKNSKVNSVVRSGEGTPVTLIKFELDGQQFLALNGGPTFKFNEAISLLVDCETQEEVDELWARLSEGGESIQCGWLKDRYGLAWQIVPTIFGELMSSPDAAKRDRVFNAMLKMTKFDIQALKDAYNG